MNLYAVGKIIGCFGVQGDLKVHPITHAPDRLTLLRDVALGYTQDEVLRIAVEHVEVRNRFVLMHFRNVDTKTDAEHLVGKYVFVDEKEIEAPANNAYFTHDIIGCEVYDTDHRHLGIVEDVYQMPAQDVWAIRCEEKVHMVPAVKEFIKEVRVRERKIIIQVIEGLIDE